MSEASMDGAQWVKESSMRNWSYIMSVDAGPL